MIGQTARAQDSIQEVWTSNSGGFELRLDPAALVGVGFVTVDSSSAAAAGDRVNDIEFIVLRESNMQIVVVNDFLGNMLGGELRGLPAFTLHSAGKRVEVASPAVAIRESNDADYDFIFRDSATGLRLFELTGGNVDFDARLGLFSMSDALARITADLAAALGVPQAAGRTVGSVSFDGQMRVTERVVLHHGDPVEAELPPDDDDGGFETYDDDFPSEGPDVIVGELPSLQQFGREGSVVGLAVGTTSCNKGNVELHWYSMPEVDHPVIPMNLYRLKDDRFEHIGQSWLKHAFTALQQNACNFGCQSSGTGTLLGVGCSDPYGAGLNSGQNGLGSRAWVNPYTGEYPSDANQHGGHSHNGISHRIQVDDADLDDDENTGAQYFAEAQYVTPHDSSGGNQYNNASYRKFNVIGDSGGTYDIDPIGNTVREEPAINAWTGSTQTLVEPAPGEDGWAILAYKVTGPVDGTYHYEYALYNMHLDRGIRRFTVPLGCGVTVSNIGFHAVKNHAGELNDGTDDDSGFSNAPWTVNQTASGVTWKTASFGNNPNANAIRWGTLHNFRFDANAAPVDAGGTVGFFKIAGTMEVATQGPGAVVLPGDLTDDGLIDTDDVAPFVAVLLDSSGASQVTLCAADVNGDGDVNGIDIQAFCFAMMGG